MRQLVKVFEDDAPQYYHGAWRHVWSEDEAQRLFAPLPEPLRASHSIVGDRERIWLRTLSKSFVAKRSSEEKAELREKVMKLLETHLGPHADGEVVDYSFATHCFVIKAI